MDVGKHAPRIKTLSPREIKRFQDTIYQHYQNCKRSLPWRKTRNPYHILVSEVMLQQTQVERVLGKYEEFIDAFPDFNTLARAPLRKVLRVWQGLGYNRRALALKKSAQIIVTKYQGKLPHTVEELVQLPGIGATTASEIVAFAFNQPAVFVETNIRSVFIHFFFSHRNEVSDAEILPLVEKTLDTTQARQWYYALMDYGVALKKKYRNPSRRSLHYRKQSPFDGSNRQIRGMILKILTAQRESSEETLVRALKKPAVQVKRNLSALKKEGFIASKGSVFTIV
jgi:A/G-specific adenine glycosylase